MPDKDLPEPLRASDGGAAKMIRLFYAALVGSVKKYSSLPKGNTID